MRKSALIFMVAALVAVPAAIQALGNDGPAWVAPTAMAVKRVSDIPSTRHQPNLFSNLDCTELTYRMVGESSMRSGCFTPTAFGMLDSDSETAIFNGTDEGLPLLAHSAHQVLAPWPKALNLVALDAASTGGSYIGMYKNPLASLRDERGWTGKLTGKRLTAAPDIFLRDSAGRQLVVNPQTMAFSSGGSWLVMETLGGSFIRVNLASLDRLAFAPAFGAQGMPGTLFKSQVAISSNGRFVAIGNHAAGSLKVYDLTGCGGGACPAHEYRPFVGRQIGGLRKIRHIRFINDGLLSFEAVTDSGNDGVYELAPEASIDHLTDYIGLGDSYTSGEGAFDYLAGTDTADNTCHLSANSYPLLLTHDLFSAAGGHSVACSGAVIDDIGSTGGGYRGQVKNGRSLDELRRSQSARLNQIISNYSPGYVPQETFVRQYQPRVVTVSIGGNDIGFGDILQRCVVPRLSRYFSDQTCYSTYEDRQEVIGLVNRTIPRWAALYKQLRSEAPGGTVYAIGYPSIAADAGKCPLNVNLGKSELEFAEELIHYLDGAIRQAAAAAGVPYVDISQALNGHRLCEASGGGVAVNGLTAGNDFGVFGIGLLGRESYHPNALGHHLIEQAILRQTDNLLAEVAPDPDDASSETGNLLDAPRTGRPVNALVPDNITDSRVARPGANVFVRVNGAHDGLRPASTYTIRLDGAEGDSLADLDSGPSGDISGSVFLPPHLYPGIHAIDVIGPGQGDDQVDISQPVYVPAPGGIDSPKSSDNASGVAGPGIVVGSNSPPPGNPKRPGSATALPGRSRAVSSDQAADSPAGRQVLGAGPIRQPESRGNLTRSLMLVLIILALPVIAAYYWRQIIKSAWYYFGAYFNNWRKKDYENRHACFTIVIMRKFGVVVFCMVFFASLLVLATSTSSNLAFTNPKQTEKWLGQSGLYSSLVDIAIEQADKTAGDDRSGGVSLSDAAVKQAAQSAFPSSLIRHNVNLFLDSNYAWLEGRTAKPEFKIDLTDAKTNFAERVGRYVETYLSTLPACTPAQEKKIDLLAVDPLTLDCRPSKLKPAIEGALVARQLRTSEDFLSDPVITAETFDSKGMDESVPYYKQYAGAPKAYGLGTKIPWIAGILVILSGVAVYFLAVRRRKGVKIIAITLAIAGVLLVLAKFVSDQIFRLLERRVFDETSIGQLQKSLTNFFHLVENQLVKIDLWFGIGYLLLAAILIGVLIITRQRGLRIPKPLQMLTPSDSSEPEEPKPKDVGGTSQPPAPKPAPKPKPRRPKPPRLVQ